MGVDPLLRLLPPGLLAPAGLLLAAALRGTSCLLEGRDSRHPRMQTHLFFGEACTSSALFSNFFSAASLSRDRRRASACSSWATSPWTRMLSSGHSHSAGLEPVPTLGLMYWTSCSRLSW